MSKVEKRHFKRFSNRHSDGAGSNYLRLFDELANMPNYDEQYLEKVFAGEPLLNNFSVAKAYLYDLVLRCLRLIHNQKSIDIELREALDNIELLHQRGLRDQAAALIRKSLRKARTFEVLPYHAELLRWQRRLVNVHTGKQLDRKLAELEAEESDVLLKLSQDAQLRSLRAQLQAIFSRQVDLRRPELQAQLDRLLEEPILRSDPTQLSFHGRIAWHFTQAYALRLKNKPVESLEMFRRLVATWQEAPKQQLVQPGPYLNALSSFLDACLTTRRYEGFQVGLSQIRDISTKDPATRARAFFLSTHLEINYALATGELEPALERAKQILSELETNLKFLSKSIELSFLYNLAVLHFAAEDYRGVVEFLNRILNQGAVAVRQDIQEAAKVLELIARYSLGQFVLMDSLLRSLRRRLKLHPRQYPFERLVVDHLSRLYNMPSMEERKPLLLALKDSLEAMLQEKELVGYEEVLLWTRAQLEGRSFRSFLQGKD